MLVTVTGASGHVGNNLVRRLLASGRNVRALVGPGDRASLGGLRVEVAECDVRDPGAVRQQLRGSDVVYHLAAVISLEARDEALMHDVNVTGVRHVLDACRDEGVRRLVHFSSVHAFEADATERVVDEQRALTTDAHDPAYNRCKAEGTRLVLDAVDKGLDAVILHPAGILGPNDFNPSHIGRYVLDVMRRKVPALVEGGYNFCDVRDVVTSAITAELHAPRGARYILGGEWTSMGDIARWVGEATGVKVPRVVTPLWLARVALPFMSLQARVRGAHPVYTSASLHALATQRNVCDALARADLGHEPRSIERSVKDTARWFVDHLAPTDQSGRFPALAPARG
jgi:dihydroflavonol-4-reductase